MILATTGGFLYKFEMENVAILQSMGYRVHYASNTYDMHYLFDEKEVTEKGVRLHHVDIARSPYMLKNNWKAFQQLIEIVDKYHIQVIHCHTPVGGVLGRLIGRYYKKRKLRVIYTAHGFHFFKGAPLINNSVYFAVEKLLAPYTDALVVINEEDYQNAKKMRLKRGGQVYKIPGVGLDTEKFKPLSSEERERKRRELGIGKEDFFLVSVGELNENKNQEVILKALLRMRYRKKNLEHIRYGICGDGFFANRIREDIRRWCLQDTVTMYGYCRNVWEILGCADISVFPSRREGLGMAGLESLAMGVPVLASDNRGTREYMRQGENGWVCSWNDVSGFCEGLERLKTRTQAEKKRMKQNCIDSVESFQCKYTNTIMRDVYDDIDRKLSKR